MGGANDDHYANRTFCLMLLIVIIGITVGEEPEDEEIETPKIYEQIESFESLNERLTSFLDIYNETVSGGRMDLVFFKVKWFAKN